MASNRALRLALALGITLGASPLALALDRCQIATHEPPPVVAQRLATIAFAQNTLMGGARIDAGGGLIRDGWSEAERTRAPGSAEATWRRVWDYWRAAPGVYARDFAPIAENDSIAAQRVAMIDYPWSAVFISWLMRAAGFNEDQFAFSALHSDYVRAALAETAAEERGEPTDYAYRACDLATTAPRVGDILCFARGADAADDTFARLRAAIAAKSLAMHCELVVETDPLGLYTVGGNVVNTVVLRRLNTERGDSGLLAAEYRAAAHRHDLEGGVPTLPDTYLSEQPWSTLLQLRQVAAAPPTPRPEAPPAAPAYDASIYRN